MKKLSGLWAFFTITIVFANAVPADSNAQAVAGTLEKELVTAIPGFIGPLKGQIFQGAAETISKILANSAGLVFIGAANSTGLQNSEVFDPQNDVGINEVNAFLGLYGIGVDHNPYAGVRGKKSITNELTGNPKISAEDAMRRIERAFKYMLELVRREQPEVGVMAYVFSMYAIVKPQISICSRSISPIANVDSRIALSSLFSLDMVLQKLVRFTLRDQTNPLGTNGLECSSAMMERLDANTPDDKLIKIFMYMTAGIERTLLSYY